MRNFIAISPVLIDNTPRYIETSTERFFLSDSITTRKAIDFLYSLHSLSRRKELKGATFIWFNSEITVQLLFKDLPKRVKDILFPSPELKRKRKALRLLIRDYDTIKRGAVINQRLTDLRERLHRLEFAYWKNYRIRYREGKALTIYRLDEQQQPKKGLTIYDISRFFNQTSIKEAATRYEIGYERKDDLYSQAKEDCQTLIALAAKLADYLQVAGIDLKRWYGPSAAVNRLLSEWKVRYEFKPITKKNTPPMLYNAIDAAFIGARIETTKLGMVNGVFTYDLNSAFAYATMLLPQLNHGWRYTREYEPEQPFALWYIDYNLPDNSYLGFFPHRRGNGSIVYRRTGRGWYYSPEVRRLDAYYPTSFTVSSGYVVPYIPVKFAEKLQAIYNFRLSLIEKEGKGKGEKIFKSILQQFYGKFAQSQGEAPYLCLPWAGWITSFVRAQLMEACAGQEESICYIHTDALHTTRPLVAPRISENIGEWKTNYYPYGFYMAPGVCCFYNDSKQIVKSATRGFEFIDFAEAQEQLNRLGSVVLERDFFAGYEYAQAFSAEDSYLKTIRQRQIFKPCETRSRKFSLESFDWKTSYVDSRIIDFDDGHESAKRPEPDLKRKMNLLLEMTGR
jgi:hypothetical protein